MNIKKQAVKLAKEIGGGKAAKELGISPNTIYTWLKNEELLYNRNDTKKMAMKEVKMLIWRYYMSY